VKEIFCLDTILTYVVDGDEELPIDREDNQWIRHVIGNIQTAEQLGLGGDQDLSSDDDDGNTDDSEEEDEAL
jgi:hypothetical protein